MLVERAGDVARGVDGVGLPMMHPGAEEERQMFPRGLLGGRGVVMHVGLERAGGVSGEGGGC